MDKVILKLQNILDNFPKENGKVQLMIVLKNVIQEIDPNVEIDALDELDTNQIWSIINSLASKSISQIKLAEKKQKEIVDELEQQFTVNNEIVFGIGKKRLRAKDKESESDNESDENSDELQFDDEEEEKEEIDENSNNENKEENNDNDKEEKDNMDENEEMDEIEEDEESEEDKPFEKKQKNKTKDHFFNMEDLNKFADELEEPELRAAPNSISLKPRRKPNQEDVEDEENNSLESEEAEVEADKDSQESVKFDEFFDAPTSKKDKGEDGDVENDLFAQISSIEQKMLGNKDWNMKGEVLSSQRPKESLLENPMDFEVTIKPPPVPDKTATALIESIIKMRIADDLFDDPVRKTKINLNKKNKDENELDFSKDRKGLGEIYEEEYTGTKKSEGKIDEIKKECDAMIEELYNTFDQLTSMRFTPHNIKPNEQSMTISNVPAIQIEEVGNFTTDNKGTVKSVKELLDTHIIKEKTKEEMTKEEKQKIHNRKKRNIRTRIHKKEQMKKMNELTQQLGSKFEAKFKMKADKDKKQMKEQGKSNEFKSTKVFGKINEIVKKDKKGTGDINYDIEVNNKKDFKKYKL